MAILLDEATKSGYDALTLASDRAAYVVASLTGTVSIEVYDSINVLRASGTMQSPWATASGSTITVGEVTGAGINVTSGGVPGALWYCQFKSGTRFVRGTFGVQGSGRDFTWSLSSFQTGSRGSLGTVVMSSTGSVITNSPPVWTTVPTITITRGTSISFPGQGYVYDPDNDAMVFAIEAGTLPTGVTFNTATGVLTAASDAPLVTGAGPIVVSADDASTTVPVSNTALPSISGTTTSGSILTGTTGTWAGTLPITYVYQWLRNGVPIASATAVTYTLGVADVGALISFRVTATNPGGTAPATSATVGPITTSTPGTLSVSFTLTSVTGGSLLPWTFGHVFKQGEWASGQITANSGEFQAVPTTYWPDGSVRHAIISGRTTLTANVALALTLAAGPQTSGAVLSLTDLKNAIPSSTTVAVGGTTMTLASTFLDSPQRVVCTGAVMSNWIYRLAVSGSNHLVIWADVRLYKGGTVEIFPWVENAYLNVASPASTVGTSCAVTVGGVSKFSQSIDIAHHSRVPLLTQSSATNAFSYWSGTDPLIAPTHDVAYLRASKMVPNFGFTSPSNTVLNALQQTYTPNTRAGVSQVMANAGGSGALIGWYGLPAQSLYCTSGDVRAYRASITFGLSAGSWSTHYRDESTNEPFRFTDRPTLSFNDGNVATGSGTTNGSAGVTHEPSFAYLPWLITGRWWFLDEQLLWVGYHFLAARPNSRRGEIEYETGPYRNATGAACVIDPRTGAWTPRGAAWGMRTLAQTLAILPDTHTCYASLKASWEANTDFYRATFVDGTFAPGWVHGLGVIGEYGPGVSLYNGGAIAPGSTAWWGAGWMQGMLQQAIGNARELSLPQSSTSSANLEVVAAQCLKLSAGLAGDGSAGSWNWRRFTVYAFPMATNGATSLPQTWISTWAAAIAAYEGGSGGLGPIAATPGLTLKRHMENTDWSAGNTEVTYGSQQLAALSYAVDVGVAGASAGRGRITGSASWTQWAAALNDEPTYGIVPRS